MFFFIVFKIIFEMKLIVESMWNTFTFVAYFCKSAEFQAGL